MKTIRRCVLLNRDEETGEIEFRHYTIKVVPVGLSKGIKKIAVGKIPNLARFEDMTEFLASKGNMTSDSEGEDDESSKVTLPQGVSARGSLPQVSIFLLFLYYFYNEKAFGFFLCTHITLFFKLRVFKCQIAIFMR